jgi:SAM-dependent methyltransferase
VIHASGLSKDTRLPSDAVSKSREKSRIEAAMVARSADTYADFLLPHLQPDMIVLDLGCGQATISIGLSETVPNGRVVGVDIDRYDLAVGRPQPPPQWTAATSSLLLPTVGGYLSATTFRWGALSLSARNAERRRQRPR